MQPATPRAPIIVADYVLFICGAASITAHDATKELHSPCDRDAPLSRAIHFVAWKCKVTWRCCDGVATAGLCRPRCRLV